MKIRISELRRIIQRVINEEAWPPGRYYPGGEPVSPDDAERLGDPLGELDDADEEDINEVDLDPTNNPGRPSDPHGYLGMRPDPKAALAHPAVSGGASRPGDVPE